MAKLTLDFSGRKGKEVFEELRATFRAKCKENVDLEVLVDDEECVRKVQTFSKMTGCKVSFARRAGGFTICVSGDACKCV